MIPESKTIFGNNRVVFNLADINDLELYLEDTRLAPPAEPSISELEDDEINDLIAQSIYSR